MFDAIVSHLAVAIISSLSGAAVANARISKRLGALAARNAQSLALLEQRFTFVERDISEIKDTIERRSHARA